MLNRVLAIVAAGLLTLALTSTAANAIGVAAGTTIENRATVTFDLGGAPLAIQSEVNVVTVAEVIDLTVTLQSTAVSVLAGDTGRVLAFLVTNTGNGVERFSLAVDDTLPGDDFDPAFDSIYLDDGDGVFDSSLDTLYVAGSNDPSLDANDLAADSIVVFVLNDIPAAAADGETGLSRLTATSTTSGAQAPGTVIPNGGDGSSIDAIVGSTGAQASADGSYVVSALVVELIKSSSILPHPVWGTQPVSGATIRYTIRVQVTGTGVADNLVISDPIPANTLYEPSSLFLDDGSVTTNLSDAADGDPGDYDTSLPGGIAVSLGNVAGGSAIHVITFNVTIDPN